MTPEELENQGLKGTKINLDRGHLAMALLSNSIRNRQLLLSIMENQIKLTQLIQDDAIDEEAVAESMVSTIEKLNEEIDKEIAETLAYFSQR